MTPRSSISSKKKKSKYSTIAELVSQVLGRHIGFPGNSPLVPITDQTAHTDIDTQRHTTAPAEHQILTIFRALAEATSSQPKNVC